MSRFKDNPELFGCGIGVSTGFKIKCYLCGTIHNKEAKDEELSTEGDGVCYTVFAGLQICDCCFEKIENEILERMDDILLWYKNILKSRRENLEKSEKLLHDCK
ncbi:MAG: hypothetical protein PHP92_03220 [Candidatus Nanoarchaeia archaeon]|nr:hypothetical protein [Candidatus Nanoarchaeia archaeon]